MKYIKSIVATVMGLVTPLAALATANGGVLTSADIKAAIATAVFSGGAVLVAPKNATSTVAGLVVKVTADLDKFKAALDTALAASLVIEPQPVVSVPVDPSAPVAPVVAS